MGLRVINGIISAGAESPNHPCNVEWNTPVGLEKQSGAESVDG